MVIDTPGMRELQLWHVDEGLGRIGRALAVGPPEDSIARAKALRAAAELLTVSGDDVGAGLRLRGRLQHGAHHQGRRPQRCQSHCTPVSSRNPSHSLRPP